MSAFGSYDDWKLATPPEYERGAQLEDLIESDPTMLKMQRRVEMAQGRVDLLIRYLDVLPPSPYRVRVLMVLRWAAAQVKVRKNHLQWAIDDYADERDDRGY